MAIATLDEAWFEAARGLVAELPERPGISCSVQFEADGLRWHQVVVDGRVTAWDVGDVTDPDLVVRLPLEVAEAAHRPGADGGAVLGRCTLVGPDGAEAPPPPLDLIDHPDLASLPEVPGADLVVQFHLANGPFGPVDVWQATVDGRLAEVALATRDDQDVEIWVTFWGMAALRSGERKLLDLIVDGARVTGDEGPLMLFAGLEEGPELQAVKRSCSRSAVVLANLGEVRADPAFQAALATLAGEEG